MGVWSKTPKPHDHTEWTANVVINERYKTLRSDPIERLQQQRRETLETKIALLCSNKRRRRDKMVDTKKSKKVTTITEEAMAMVLQRYSVITILLLLQEVCQHVDKNSDEKIDWSKLLGKTSTGIKNALEYQMIWRHLAYQTGMQDDIKDGAKPMDDDSDVESVLEAYPPVSNEESAEAAACAKVLLASGSPSNTGPLSQSMVEGPMIIQMPNDQSSRAPSDNPHSASAQGTRIIVPVYVQNQSLPAGTLTEGLEGNGASGSSLPACKKRKPRPWTKEEDMELIAAVQKCGEGNWSFMIKGDFKGDRTASQLSKRWPRLKKHQEKLISGGEGNMLPPRLSEKELANQAVSHALDIPVLDSLLPACSTGILINSSLGPNPKAQTAAVVAAPTSAASLTKAADSKNAGV